MSNFEYQVNINPLAPGDSVDYYFDCVYKADEGEGNAKFKDDITNGSACFLLWGQTVEGSKKELKKRPVHFEIFSSLETANSFKKVIEEFFKDKKIEQKEYEVDFLDKTYTINFDFWSEGKSLKLDKLSIARTQMLG